MSRSILVSGATGNQGGAVVNALLALPNSDFTILAVTRDAKSSGAQRLAAKSSSIKIVEGTQDDVPALFANAKKASPDGKIWGVFSVQISMGSGVTFDGEIRQGKAMIDASKEANVESFVYTSVDRGGDQKSWETETSVPHFQSKHQIEHYLRDNAGSMPWTILRPVAFMDNLAPAFQNKVFLASLKNWLGDKKLQWVAVRDIGVMATKVFSQPQSYNHTAVGLAGDELNVKQMTEIFAANTKDPISPTFSVLGSMLTTLVKEFGLMIKWFASDGYGVDIAKLKGIHPDLLDLKAWIKRESKFTSK